MGAHPTEGQSRPECHVVVEIDLHQALSVAGDGETRRGNVKLGVFVTVNGDTTETSREIAHDHVEREPEEEEDDSVDELCVVCREPLEWVAIGRCGHRVVCRKCMVRIRFIHGYKLCCVCKIRCPKIIVAKRDADADILSTLPPFTLREGRTGKFWYHRDTAAYYEDEQGYKAARAACHGIMSPFCRRWLVFVLLFGGCIFFGAVIGWGYALETKHRSTKVRAYAVSISVAVSIATIIWSAIRQCSQDPLELERITIRHAQKQ